MRKISLSDSAIIVSLGHVFERMSPFILGIFLARLLSPDELGTYKQVWLVYATLSGVLLLGIPRSIYYFFPTLPTDKKKGFMFQTMINLITLGMVTAFMVYFIAPSLSRYFHNPQIVKLLRIFSIYVFFSFSNTYFLNLLIAQKRYKMVALVSVLAAFSMATFIIVPALLGKGLEVIFLSLCGFGAFQSLIYLIYTIGNLKSFRLLWDKNLLISQFKYSIPLGISASTYILAKQVDKVIISLSFIPKEFAVYAIGAIELPVFAIINMSVNTILRVKFAELYKEKNSGEILRLWHEAIRKQAIIYMPIFAILFTFATPFMTLLYTNTYAGSVTFFRIYLFLVPLRVATYSIILTSSGRTRPIMYGDISYLMANTVFSIIAVRLLGAVGPALVTVGGHFLLAFYYLLLVHRVLKTSFANVFPWRLVGKMLGITALLGGLLYPLNLLELPRLPTIILGLSLFLPLYIIIFYKLKIITPAEKRLIKGWLVLKPLFGS